MAKKRVVKMNKEFQDAIKRAHADGKMTALNGDGNLVIADRKNAKKGRR